MRQKKTKKRRKPVTLPETTEPEKTNEELVADIQATGDQHGQKMLYLMQKNRGFLMMKARPFVQAGAIEQNEIQSIGFVAVSAAVEHFKPSGVSFLKVLSWFLTKELIIASNDNRTVPLPYYVGSKVYEYTKWRTEFKRLQQREPTEREILKGLGLTREQLHNVQSAMSMQFPLSLDASLPDDEDGNAADDTIMDTVPDPCKGIEDTVMDEELKKALAAELETMPEDERTAIYKRFFDGDAIGDDVKVYRKAMSNLTKPERMKRLSQYYTGSFYGGGWQSFRVSFTSRPEQIAMEHDRARGSDK